jgi:predicted methyltransferase
MQRASMLTVAVLAAGLAIPAARAAHPAGVPPYIKAAVADKARPPADTEHDANRKPAETLAFAGVKSGDWVLEIAPGKGYFTRMLSAVVGPQGEVTNYLVSQPPKADTPPPPILAVAAEPHYSNVKVHLLRLVDVKPTNSFDVAWTTQNYHDIHNIDGVDVAAFNRAIFAALKPGGTFLVLDHSAEAGSGLRDTKTLHRIDEATVKQEVTAGFELVGESNLLRNKNDPRTAKVFDSSIQGHTDQFLLKFRKPAK